MREICRRLNAEAIPSPTGKPTWGHSTICRLLRNEAYVGRVYYNRTESVPDRRPTRRTRQVPRDRDEWIPIDCPRIVSDELFQAAGRVATDNTKWSPRRAEPGQWLLKGLVKCGACGVGTNCHKMRGRNGTWHRYYYCRNHDSIRAGGESRRCPERNIRADALDAFVFDHIRAAITHPDQLLAGEQAVTLTTPIPDDELLTAELARLDRKIEAADTERRRLIDLYQGGFIELAEMQRRATDVSSRRQELQHKRTSLAHERTALARDNQLRRRVHDFAARIHAVIDTLDDTQKQQLLRLLIEDVRVTGWHVQIRLRIALAPPPPHPTGPTNPKGKPSSPHPRPVSSQDGLRSVSGDDFGVVDEAVDHGGGHDVIAEHFAPAAEGFVGGDDQAGPFVARGHQLEEQVGGFGFEGDVADLVDDDERVAPEPGEFGLDTAGVVGFSESGYPFGGGGEQDTVPGLAGPHGQADREVCFAGARWPQEDSVVACGDEIQCSEVGDGVAFEAAGMVEVELLQRFSRREPGGADTTLTAVGFSCRYFALQARRQVFLVAPVLRPGPFSQPSRGLTQRRGLERPGQVGDLCGHVTR